MLFTVIGFVGVAFILVGYYLVQTSKIPPEGLIYPTINCIGSAFIIISLITEFNLPTLIINIAWIMISLIGIFRWYQRN